MQEIFIYTRTIELLAAIIVGAFLCWLGYRLFFKVLPDKSDLKMEYGKIRLQLFNASPGILFSLFGAVIIASVVWNTAKFKAEVISPESSKISTVIEKSVIEKSIRRGSDGEIRSFEDILIASNQAYRQHSKGNLNQAKTLYLKILSAVPELNKITNNLADIFRTQGDMDTATVYARFCAVTYPDFEEARKTLEQLPGKAN